MFTDLLTYITLLPADETDNLESVTCDSTVAQ